MEIETVYIHCTYCNFDSSKILDLLSSSRIKTCECSLMDDTSLGKDDELIVILKFSAFSKILLSTKEMLNFLLVIPANIVTLYGPVT